MSTNPNEQAHLVSESPTLPLPPPSNPRRLAVQSESATGERGEPPPQLEPITRDDIARNNLRLKALPANLRNLEAFLPEIQKKTPVEVLQILRDRYVADPNPANASLLQYAVNRITTGGPVDTDMKEAIARAIEVLRGSSETEPGTADALFCWAYVDADFGGASMFLDLSPGWIYWAEFYVGDAMNDKISSLICTCTSGEVAGNFCLFENANFIGRYQNYKLTLPPGDEEIEEDVSYVGDDFNDITSSILLVRRFANETSPVSIGALVPQSSITTIVNAQSQVSSAGATTFTWDLWPTGPTSSSDWHPNDPDKAFIYVIVPVNIDTQTIFGTYSAQVRYWIYLYVDRDGNLQGYVDWYGCWVQGGWITGDVQNALMQKIPGTIGQVNNLVSNALALANIGGPYRFSYYLPGKNAFTGSTWDDVTVVAVRQ